jgi:hypothetical protein
MVHPSCLSALAEGLHTLVDLCQFLLEQKRIRDDKRGDLCDVGPAALVVTG